LLRKSTKVLGSYENSHISLPGSAINKENIATMPNSLERWYGYSTVVSTAEV